MFYCRDLTVVELKMVCEERPEEIIIGSGYLPHDIPKAPLNIISCDASADNQRWGSTNTNESGEYWLQFIKAEIFDILKLGKNH